MLQIWLDDLGHQYFLEKVTGRSPLLVHFTKNKLKLVVLFRSCKENKMIYFHMWYHSSAQIWCFSITVHTLIETVITMSNNMRHWGGSEPGSVCGKLSQHHYFKSRGGYKQQDKTEYQESLESYTAEKGTNRGLFYVTDIPLIMPLVILSNIQWLAEYQKHKVQVQLTLSLARDGTKKTNQVWADTTQWKYTNSLLC